jgi:hypothetical protein
MDPDTDPDPSIFITDQDANKKLIKKKVFLYITFLRYFYIISKIQSQKENSKNQGFSYYICLMIEGSGSGSRAGSGSIPLTNGSGSRSGRPKNTWIRNIACCC